MDRVLIVCEEAIFSNHVEKTLIEVGFEVATQPNEAGLQEAIINFNPDILVVKGDSAKLSTLRVGQTLRETIKYPGKVILILNKNQKIDPTDLNRVKMDYLLFEPVGAVKVVSHVLNLITEHREAIKSRLIKIAESETFKEKEKNFLVSGKSIAQELVHVTGKIKKEKFIHVKSSDDPHPEAPSAEALTEVESEQIKSKFMHELAENERLLKAKIDSYNNSISNIDVDLKLGHKKRHTSEAQRKLRKEVLVDPAQEKLDSLDHERRQFAAALVKKK